MNTLLLQLADSAFPSGTFAHSLGIEALRQFGHVRVEAQLALRVREIVWHVALGGTPFVAHAHALDASEADRLCHAFTSSHVASRASRAQGAAFLLGAEAIFGSSVTTLRGQLPFAHCAVAMGGVLAQVDVSVEEARRLFLFAAVRSALSAAVRLGAIGPLRSQALLYSLHGEMEAALRHTRGWFAAHAVNTAPLLELCQGAQDRLYSRLFQS